MNSRVVCDEGNQLFSICVFTVMHSRIAAKTIHVPPVSSTLGAPQLLFQWKTEQTTNQSLMRKMPSLSTCQAVRSSLYKMKENASEKVKMECEPVSRWQNFGTFSWDDFAYFVNTRWRQQKGSGRKCKVAKPVIYLLLCSNWCWCEDLYKNNLGVSKIYYTVK